MLRCQLVVQNIHDKEIHHMRNTIYTIGIILCVCCMVLSGIMIYRHYAQDKQYTDEFDDLAALINQADDQEESVPFSEDETVLPEYAALYLQNSDMVGWIKIEGTTIDYPVMQTPDDPDYYLKHNFEKQDSDYGVPYAAGDCDVFEPSDNVIIYGHHIKNGKMFGALEDYKNQSFYEGHKIIQFDTLTEKAEYEIIAVFKTVVYSESGFAFYSFIHAANEDDFNAYVSKCKELSLYDTGVTAEYGDKLLTLSTCEYSSENGRLVVVAKKISD